MAAILRNLLILDKYWLGRSAWVPGRSHQTRPDFVKGMSFALSSPEEIRSTAMLAKDHGCQRGR
jgi:hypothetical protein